jgi:isopentenyldiphosphate isomerase
MNKNEFEEEILPLINEEGEIIGKASRSICHSSKEYLHPVVHLHVINSKGEIYLQKRPLDKKIQPGKWDTAVGGHIAYGESIELGLQREAFEEIGLKDPDVKLAAKYIWESEVEREFVFSFITHYDGELTINKEELTDGKFWSIEEIKRNLGKGIFTPNFEVEFEKIFGNLTNNVKTYYK